MAKFLQILAEKQSSDLLQLNEKMDLKSILKDLTDIKTSITDLSVLNNLVKEFKSFITFKPTAKDMHVYTQMRNGVSQLISTTAEECDNILKVAKIPQVEAIKKLLQDMSHTTSITYQSKKKVFN